LNPGAKGLIKKKDDGRKKDGGVPLLGEEKKRKTPLAQNGKTCHNTGKNSEEDGRVRGHLGGETSYVVKKRGKGGLRETVLRKVRGQDWGDGSKKTGIEQGETGDV